MQEELHLGQQAQTTHTPPPSQTYRVQLSPEILDPLCHGLGHAIYRLALAMQRGPQTAASLALTTECPVQQAQLFQSLGLIAGTFQLCDQTSLH